MHIPITRLDPDATLPGQAHDDDAGYDLCANEDVVLAPRGGRALVPTGLAVAIPAGHGGFVLPRSGLALKHGVTVLNAPGLIDPQYRGELKVLLVNTDPDDRVRDPSWGPHRAARDRTGRVRRVAAGRHARRDHAGHLRLRVDGSLMPHPRRFRFGVLAKAPRAGRRVRRLRAPGRGARLLDALHARSLRGPPARADAGDRVRRPRPPRRCASGRSCSATTTSIRWCSPPRRRPSTS